MGYRIADDVAWVSREELDNGSSVTAYVTLMPHGGPLTMEGSACLVWLALDEGGTLDEITAVAADMADIDRDQIRGDVLDLIEQLVGAGLVSAG